MGVCTESKDIEHNHILVVTAMSSTTKVHQTLSHYVLRDNTTEREWEGNLLFVALADSCDTPGSEPVLSV